MGLSGAQEIDVSQLPASSGDEFTWRLSA